MMTSAKEVWKKAERWVHRQNQIVSSISHLLICAAGTVLFGVPAGVVALWVSGPFIAVWTVGVVALLFTGFYFRREIHDMLRKGFRQAARDGDTPFGPDFILAVVGSVAGFVIVRAILGI